ncbi:uncharacterized protein [Chelonus insularis]|uniref:uncharacterized protein n=1 Tax=Chelonus insularis TaxID=460826 RepID=UPI00158D60B3|nr:uncharacterized protein LOC118066992 [Chelonus insularis]
MTVWSLSSFFFKVNNIFLWLLIVLIFVSPFSCSIETICINDSIKTFAHFRPTNSIYYNLKNSESLKIQTNDSEKLPGYPLRFISNFNGCNCNGLTCGCCAGIRLNLLNFDRKVCTNITIVPEEFAVDFIIHIDDQEVIKQRVTGKNPPPLCVPLYFIPIIDFCARLHSISVFDYKINICIDFETRIATQPIFILHFDCVQIGTDGISWNRPQNLNFIEPHPIFSAFNISNLSTTEVYDEVLFEPENIETSYPSSYTNLTLDEIHIGTLKQ